MKDLMTVLLRWFIPITLYYIAFGLMDNTGWESLLIGLLFAGGVLINVLSYTNKKLKRWFKMKGDRRK